MSQGITINGKTVDDKNIAVRVNSLGQIEVVVVSGGGGGGGVAKATDTYGIQAISDDGTYKYFFFEADNADYYVMRKHKTNKTFSYTKGTGGYATVYVNPTSPPSGSPTWADRGVTF